MWLGRVSPNRRDARLGVADLVEAQDHDRGRRGAGRAVGQGHERGESRAQVGLHAPIGRWRHEATIAQRLLQRRRDGLGIGGRTEADQRDREREHRLAGRRFAVVPDHRGHAGAAHESRHLVRGSRRVEEHGIVTVAPGLVPERDQAVREVRKRGRALGAGGDGDPHRRAERNPHPDSVSECASPSPVRKPTASGGSSRP
jgi:hypothetical protein